MLIHLHLHGRLGNIFGRNFCVDAKSPAHAVRAVMLQKPGFKEHILERDKAGVQYRIKIDEAPMAFKEQLFLPAKKRVDIFPVVVGSKAGALDLVIGALLIVAAVVVTVYTGGAGAGLFSGLSTTAAGGGTVLTAAGNFVAFAALMGTSMILQGLSAMVANPQSTYSAGRSYVFGGPATTSQQGAPVPIGYGTLFVGPIVVNAGMDSFDINPSNGVLDTTGSGAGIVNGGVTPSGYSGAGGTSDGGVSTGPGVTTAIVTWNPNTSWDGIYPTGVSF